MNLLTDPLPYTVQIGGRDYKINTDFRTSIKYELLMFDDEVSPQDKMVQALTMYYPEMPEDLEEAIYQIIWFYSCGTYDREKQQKKQDEQQDEEQDEDQPEKIYDFAYDADYIFAAFYGQYGIDLTAIKNLHWWKFRALFNSLQEDWQFVKIMGYRGMTISPKMSADQKSFYYKMKEIHALPLSKTEQEKEDEMTEVLLHGGNVGRVLNKNKGGPDK